MAEGVNLATAYVSLVPSMRGFRGKVGRELGGVDRQFSDAGASSGRRFSDGFKRRLKIGAAVGGALAAVGTAKFLSGSIREASDLN